MADERYAYEVRVRKYRLFVMADDPEIVGIDGPKGVWMLNIGDWYDRANMYAVLLDAVMSPKKWQRLYHRLRFRLRLEPTTARAHKNPPVEE